MKMRKLIMAALLGAMATAARGEPSCDELIQFGADSDPGYVEKAKTSLFGKPLSQYRQAELTSIRLNACRQPGRVFMANTPEYDNLMRAGRKLQALQAALAAGAGIPPAGAAVATGPAAAGAMLTCAEIVHYGAEKNLAEYRDQAKKDFFGKPLAEYSKADMVGVMRVVQSCERTVGGPDFLSFVAGRQKIETVRGMHQGMLLSAEQAAAEERQAKVDAADRTKLRSGERKVSNIRDAAILHEAKELGEIMGSPLIRPDQAVYGGRLVLDAEERTNLLRGRWGVVIFGKRNVSYAFLKMSDKTVLIDKPRLRIGGDIAVVGKYVGNQKYKTLAGEERTAPVLDVMYLSEYADQP
jgi:hypothetical protein